MTDETPPQSPLRPARAALPDRALTGRPEVLFPLFAALDSLSGIGPSKAKAFAALSVIRPRDLLLLMPHTVTDRRLKAGILQQPSAGIASFRVEILSHAPPPRKGAPHRIIVSDQQEESWPLVFFHPRLDYLKQLLPIGAHRLVSGKVEWFEGRPQMINPDYILPPERENELPPFAPVYPLAAGLGQKQVVAAVQSALKLAPQLDEWIDPFLKDKEGWPSWHSALTTLHCPTDTAACSANTPAKRRLAYDELFAHQLTLALARAQQRHRPGLATQGTGDLRAKVLSALPYTPTSAQLRAIDEILRDMAAEHRMNRLLQGDVGAGKTLVAFMALLGAVEAQGQGVLMTPTEILARQHYSVLRPLAEMAGIRLALLTGRDRGAERARKLHDLAAGDIHILIGTHAVFQKDVDFCNLRLAVVDEQHRFGVAQRLALGSKGQAVDVLIMTATPIPRSLALACYGDMDVSILDEKPPGRQPIRTALIADNRLDEVVTHLKNAIAAGHQAYWVCPLVEDSELVDYSSAEQRYNHLRAALGDQNVGLVHGQMINAEKDQTMAAFVAGETRVLVATTVIEVGIDVPAASIMVIERAEVFGLAQLHQLRGRVGRGEAQSTCLLMYQPPLSETAARRLKILRDTEDGFRIAEEDLAIRGAGDLIGTAQSGVPRFRIAETERDGALMQLAWSDARNLLAQDPLLNSARGRAARTLLWLMEQDRAIRLIRVG